MSIPLSIRLLGPVQVQMDGEILPRMRTKSVEWLLALLVLRRARAVDREWLAGTLWIDSDRDQALRNLRNNLTHLRNALGKEGARIASPSRDTLRFELEGADVDVVTFDDGIASRDRAALEAAVKAYVAPLLEGCDEAWVHVERESRAAQWIAGVERLADLSNPEAAIAYLTKAESLEPLRESITRRLMSALAAKGDSAAALEVYRRLRYRLHDELGSQPGPETESLYKSIRSENRTPKTHPANLPALNCRRLPYPITPLIGRDREVQEVVARMGSARLTTLVGAGGVGKTRLAIEAARAMEEEFEHGAVFVELAPILDESQLLTRIGIAIGLREDDVSADALASWLTFHQVLLVLDNCEHMVEAVAGTVSALMTRVPQLRVLTTSRQRLGFPGEAVYRVPSLPFPTDSDSSGDYPAVRLFAERAMMASPSFDLDIEREAVVHICRRLDGIPLAIELAAARIGLMSASQIVKRLDDRFRLLTDGNRAALPRHQTLSALIDWSYDQLSDREQTLLRRLGVFVGGWTLEAAESIGADVSTLASLVDRSMVVAETSANGVRYRMLETLREYLRDKRRAVGEDTEAEEAHTSYCLQLVEAQASSLRGPNPEAALDSIDAEINNIRAALAHSPSDDAFVRIASAMWPYWEMRGPVAEGREALRLATEKSAETDTAELNLGAASLAFVQKDLPETLKLAEVSASSFRAADNHRGLAKVLILWGHACIETSSYDTAEIILNEALEKSQECDWPGGMALAVTHLGLVSIGLKRYDEAGARLKEAVDRAEAVGHLPTLALSLHNLGYFAQQTGNDALGTDLMQRSLDGWRKVGHFHKASLSLRHLGQMARGKGDLDQSLAYFTEATAICRLQGSAFHLGFALMEAGSVRYQQGEFEEARAAFEECVGNFSLSGSDWGINAARMNLATTLFRLGETEKSKQTAASVLVEYRKQGNLEGITWALELLAMAESQGIDYRRASELLGEASAARTKLREARVQLDQVRWNEAVARVRDRMVEAEFREAWSEGERSFLDCMP